MTDADDDPRCPECGGPIGMTATYCMHCSADLTDERAAADADGDGYWDESGAEGTDARPDSEPTDSWSDTESTDSWSDTGSGVSAADTATAGDDTGQMLDPDGFADDTLTVIVGIVGGLVVGLVGTIVLGLATGSGSAVGVGIVAWLGATSYLVRRRTVQEAVSKSAYAVAAVLLLVPLIAVSPVITVDGGTGDRGGLFFVLLIMVAVPAAIAGAIGWFASQFVPDDAPESDAGGGAGRP